MIPGELKEQVHSCIRCGLCMNSCPVYRQLYFEGASPRGKIQLIKKVLEGKLEPSENFYRLLGTCLLCDTCSVTCPSGVRLDRLMKAMRAELAGKFRMPREKRAVLYLLSSSRLLPFCISWGRAIQNPLRYLLPEHGKLGTIPYSKLPRLSSKPFLSRYPETVLAAGPRKGRVLYFVGCATNYLAENVGDSVIGVLTRLGVEVIMPEGQMCCGFPICLAGAREKALRNIRRNIELFDRPDVDAVVVDCATCGAALKNEYPQVLEEMGKDAEAARRVARKVQDISQVLSRFDLSGILRPLRARVTYHDPCHLLRSQRVREEPRDLLKRIPQMEFVEMAAADACCGGGGAFQVEHPDVAAGITATKVQSILETGAGLVATGCPGCRLQIRGNLADEAIRVVHPVELLAMAMGLD
jgi:glycolate dehydrogenase iron-sulfur subunit